MIPWKWIQDEQPEHGRIIVQVEHPYKNFYKEGSHHILMGMREYFQKMPWEEIMEENRREGWHGPDFYWCYAEEFPFPDFSKKVGGANG